ncbi:RICIN domain-containing protein [Kitasatospora sp. NPDC001603]|uniref:RICIN domain-containing protein n=1 Tax=Kitasatospora sp. NPDC001603 TaxID=3154388 RepID=UPI0033264E69
MNTPTSPPAGVREPHVARPVDVRDRPRVRPRRCRAAVGNQGRLGGRPARRPRSLDAQPQLPALPPEPSACTSPRTPPKPRCSTATSQQWKTRKVTGSTSVKLVARHSGKCLDVTNQSTADGTSLEQWTCNTGDNQQWQRTTV